MCDGGGCVYWWPCSALTSEWCTWLFIFSLMSRKGSTSSLMLDVIWSGMKITDVIDKIIQFKATTLCGFDYVVIVTLV